MPQDTTLCYSLEGRGPLQSDHRRNILGERTDSQDREYLACLSSHS